jgi:hypothetical protein
MTDHAWINENLDGYLAGELTTSEREKVEAHLAECAECGQTLADLRQLDRVMTSVFADARPDATLDERIVRELGKEPMRAFRRPSAWRFVLAAAAVLVIGLIGAVAQAMMNEGGMSFAKGLDGPIVARSQSSRIDFIGGTKLEEAGAVTALVEEFEKELGKESLSKQIVTQEYQEGVSREITSLPVPVTKKYTGAAIEQPAASEGKLKLDDITYREKSKELTELFLRDLTNKKDLKVGDKSAKYYELRSYFDTPDVLKNLDKLITQDPKTGESKIPDGEKGKSELPSPSVSAPPPSPMTPALPGYLPPAPSPVVPTNGTTVPYFGKPTAPPVVPIAPPVDPSKQTGEKGGEKGDKGADGKRDEEGDKKPGQDQQKPAEGKPGDPKGEPKADPKQQPAEPPIETNRKIIRTGEMEFEIDSFDKSVDSITKIITSVKGGFIATVNSDKLANGKMRGSVVVRMPPQYLDKFVMDLRRELAKVGELKNQRIISLDVTKQYTDIESRLRAARTMEDRLIQIIKIGKGEIKDLVAAEKELGVWRTKIEEMEGEIRYYANQVSLSTLTITLLEKELQTPTALVVTETVRMRLEVEDVAKAHQAAMAAVEEAKGRITKSELKQHSAGQLQSILHADIPPAQKEAFRDKLKKLGIVSAHEENQSQHTEGGTGKGGGLKPRQDDVHFDITMYNTANVRPRLIADLKVATEDVPSAYAKLLAAIDKAKGQVRDGKLNEQDKLNVHAILDFNVPTSEKPAIDKVIADIGPVLERVNLLAPVSELSTERKFGYTVLLRDFDSIPPSKAAVETLATFDVPASYARVLETIAKVKGIVADAKLNEQDKLNINAQIDFTIPSEEQATIEKLFKEIGTQLLRTNVRAPLKQLSTARKFGYTLVLRDFASVSPTKASDLKVAVHDVPATYAKLLDAIAKAKGQVADAKLNEQDKLHITAQIAFTVPSEEKSTIDKLIGETGTILSRNNVSAPANQLATAKKFGYTLDLRDFATIPPSHMSAVTIAASNVPSNYAKLLDAISKAKGHVADAKLNEQNKLDVTGTINFTVPKSEKQAIEALLSEIGTMLSRTNAQVPAEQLSTDIKFGYSVTLRDFANIRPRETFIVQVALNDVSASFRELQDAVAQARGWINVGKLTENDRTKIEAQIDFDVPTGEKAAIEKLLAKTGAVMSRTSSQVPVNELATDQKVGYQVSLRSTASIPPREKTLIKLEVNDVDTKSAEIKDIVAAGKGRVIDSTVDRHESGLVTAAIKFEVPFASQEALLRQMKGTGKVISQRSTRDVNVTENELTTAHIIVTLTGADPIVPSDEGIASYVRTSLYLSFKILSIIVMSIIVGLSAIVPCVLLIWLGFKAYALLFGSSDPIPPLTPIASGSAVISEVERPTGNEPSPKP